MSDYVRIQDIRYMIWDRVPLDNVVDMDLAFNDEDIEMAMRAAARAYNSIPPLISNVTPDKMPARTNLFIWASVEFLLRAKLAQLRRNAVSYSAGGVQVSADAEQIGYLEKELNEVASLWRAEAQQLKLHQNLQNAYFAV